MVLETLAALARLVERTGSTDGRGRRGDSTASAVSDALAALAAAQDARSREAVCAVIQPRASAIAELGPGAARQHAILLLAAAADATATLVGQLGGAGEGTPLGETLGALGRMVRTVRMQEPRTSDAAIRALDALASARDARAAAAVCAVVRPRAAAIAELDSGPERRERLSNLLVASEVAGQILAEVLGAADVDGEREADPAAAAGEDVDVDRPAAPEPNEDLRRALRAGRVPTFAGGVRVHGGGGGHAATGRPAKGLPVSWRS